MRRWVICLLLTLFAITWYALWRRVPTPQSITAMQALTSASTLRDSDGSEIVYAAPKLSFNGSAIGHVRAVSGRSVSADPGWELQSWWQIFAETLEPASAQWPCVLVLFRTSDRRLMSVQVMPESERSGNYMVVAKAFRVAEGANSQHTWEATPQTGSNQLRLVFNGNDAFDLRAQISNGTQGDFVLRMGGQAVLHFDAELSRDGIVSFRSDSSGMTQVVQYPNRWLELRVGGNVDGR